MKIRTKGVQNSKKVRIAKTREGYWEKYVYVYVCVVNKNVEEVSLKASPLDWCEIRVHVEKSFKALPYFI